MWYQYIAQAHEICKYAINGYQYVQLVNMNVDFMAIVIAHNGCDRKLHDDKCPWKRFPYHCAYVRGTRVTGGFPPVMLNLVFRLLLDGRSY